LLLLGDLKEPPRCFAVRLGHNTILQLSWHSINQHDSRESRVWLRIGPQFRQGYALGSYAGGQGHPSRINNFGVSEDLSRSAQRISVKVLPAK
jgi:hypothetical protein